MKYIIHDSYILFRGNYSEALGHFERALSDGTGEHNASCRGGIARCAIRCGDFRRGIGMATDNNASKQLKQQCAEILEHTKVGNKVNTQDIKET